MAERSCSLELSYGPQWRTDVRPSKHPATRPHSSLSLSLSLSFSLSLSLSLHSQCKPPLSLCISTREPLAASKARLRTGAQIISFSALSSHLHYVLYDF